MGCTEMEIETVQESKTKDMEVENTLAIWQRNQ